MFQEGKKSQRVLGSIDKKHAREMAVIKQWQQVAAQDTNSIPGPILFLVWRQLLVLNDNSVCNDSLVSTSIEKTEV